VKFEKATVDFKHTEQVEVRGYSLVKMPGVGPAGHLGITRLRVGRRLRGYCKLNKEQDLFFIQPNGILILETEKNH